MTHIKDLIYVSLRAWQVQVNYNAPRTQCIELQDEVDYSKY